MRVSAISFGNNLIVEKKDQGSTAAQNVATGVGATGFATTASKAARKGDSVRNGLVKTRKIIQRCNSSSSKLERLFGKFLSNSKEFATDIAARLGKLKSVKFIGSLISTPLIKGASKLLGGTLAFFVLITGINKAFKIGKRAALNYANAD